MYRWAFVVVGLLAFVCSGSVWAIVQETSSTVTKPDTIKSMTVTITQKTDNGETVGKRTEIKVTKKTATRRVRVDDQKTDKVEITVTVDGRNLEPKIVSVAIFLGGGLIDLGEGITLQNTPATAGRQPATGERPRPPGTGVPDRQPRGTPYEWSGFYLGGGIVSNTAEFGITEKSAATGATTFSANPDATNLGGGVSFGYGSIVSSGSLPVVFSPFFSADFPNNTVKHDFAGGQYIKEDIKFIGTLGGQAGILVTPELQLYGLVGIALANKEFGLFLGGPVTTEDQWLWGATIGVGAAYRFTGFNVYAQWQRFWFETANIDMPLASPAFNYEFKNDVDVFKLGVTVPIYGGGWGPNPANLSDIRLKRDIERFGRLDNGLSLYRYRYLWSDIEYVGVMAQEVAEIRPDAVFRASTGSCASTTPVSGRGS
jgi:hypothetical protein